MQLKTTTDGHIQYTTRKSMEHEACLQHDDIHLWDTEPQNLSTCSLWAESFAAEQLI